MMSYKVDKKELEEWVKSENCDKYVLSIDLEPVDNWMHNGEEQFDGPGVYRWCYGRATKLFSIHMEDKEE